MTEGYESTWHRTCGGNRVWQITTGAIETKKQPLLGLWLISGNFGKEELEQLLAPRKRQEEENYDGQVAERSK